MKSFLYQKSLEKKNLMQKGLMEEETSKLNKNRYEKMKHPYVRKPFANPTNERKGSCEDEDAFKGVPIDGIEKEYSVWKPPDDTSVEYKKEWLNSYMEMITRIKSVELGGEELREYARNEIGYLKTIRHRLFCSENVVGKELDDILL